MPAMENTIKQSASLEDAVKLYLKIPSTNKAKDDMDVIMGRNGFRDIAWSIDSHNSIARFISKLVSVLLVLVRVKKGNVLLIQYPFKKYYSLVCRLAHFKGGKVVTLVHDLGCFRRKKLTIAQELVRINHTDVLIVHNEAMEQFLLSQGYRKPMVTLGIFDYLSSYPGRRPEKTVEEEWKVVYAGGLSHRKNSFLYELDDKIHNWHFHIYGGGLDEDKAKGWKNITPMGLVTPDYLISNSIGHFGLVWDGSSIDECAGDWGEYLKVNNPHKTSCYLRSGKPVIMWNQSALAPFVEKEGIGFTVGSLRDIDERIKDITLEKYKKMCDNAEIMSKRLAEGYYFKKAFAEAYDLLDIVRKG